LGTTLVARSFTAALLLTGCAGGAGVRTAAPPVVGFRVYDTRTAAFVPFERVVDAAAGADLVFFGEYHDDPETHRAELALLDGLATRGRRIVLSLEMFERDVQPVVDDYLAGRITESIFLARARPWPRYATDYRALVERAKAAGWPVIASNIPRSLASAVGRKGLAAFDTLGAAERRFAATANECPKDDYYRRFIEAMPSHNTAGSAPVDTAQQRATSDRFFIAQCVKDEAMAESVSAAAQRLGSGSLVVHYDGAFHSDFRDGTVSRALRRMPGARSIVISAIPLADPATADGPAHARRADFVIFTARAPRPPDR
jgi:uncharacterized iron-regulated protein